MDDNERLHEIIRRREIWDSDPVGAVRNIGNPAFRAEQDELMWFGGQVPFLLQQIKQRDKQIENIHSLYNTDMAKMCEENNKLRMNERR